MRPARAIAAALSLTTIACGDSGGAGETESTGGTTGGDTTSTGGDTTGPEPTTGDGTTAAASTGEASTGEATTGEASTGEATTGETNTEGTSTGDPPAGGVFVVAVGEQGTILHCDEEACAPADSPVATELDDALVLAADRAYVVGSKGVMLEWDGADWTKVDVPTQANLSTIAALDDDTLMVGGSDGTLLRRDGETWTEVDHPLKGAVERTVHEIEFIGPDFGLAVVSSFAVLGQSTILRWDGETWTVEREGMDNMLSSLDVASPTLAAAGGYAATPLEPLNLITRAADATWTRVEDIAERNFVTGVSFASESFGMAVTDLSFGPNPPAIVLWDGATWTAEEVLDAHAAVHLIDAELGFLVGWGDDDGAFVERWQAGELTRLPTDSTASALWDVHGIRLP